MFTLSISTKLILLHIKALQQELVGETDDEVEKFKCRLIEEMPLTDSQEEGNKKILH